VDLALLKRTTTLFLAAALGAASCATWARTGRIINDPCIHVGVRPASDGLGDYAVTVQITTDWPARCYATDAGPRTDASVRP
jgi:hypothetical protein